MELRHLRYLVGIVDAGSFRRAGEALHVSQSPLSRQMQDLADEVGVALFEPEGRGVKPTAAGAAFAERARAILASVDAAVVEARGIAEGRLGSVTIGFETGAAFLGAFAAVVAGLRKRAPLVDIQLVPLSSVEQWDALRRGAIVFGYGAETPLDPELRHLAMRRDRLGVVLAGEHRLAKRARLKLADLAGERIILQPRHQFPRLHGDLLAAARARGVELSVSAEVVDGEALLALVAIGDAVTFQPERSVEVLRLTSAVWRPVSDLGIDLVDVVAWRADQAKSPLVSALIESAREARQGDRARAGR